MPIMRETQVYSILKSKIMNYFNMKKCKNCITFDTSDKNFRIVISTINISPNPLNGTYLGPYYHFVKKYMDQLAQLEKWLILV